MIYFLSHNNIQSESLELLLESKLLSIKSFIYLCATQNLKNMRADSPILGTKLIPLKPNEPFANLYSITEYQQSTAKRTYESKAYLSSADQKYILSKVIQHFYKDTPAKQSVMYAMRYDLYELYKLLMFHNKKITATQIEKIQADYSKVESDIFEIYSLYQAITEKTIAYISCGQNDKLLTDVMGNDFLKATATKPIMPFVNKQKEIICDEIKGVDALFFDGFLFLDEMQRFILTAAVKQGKSVYFISKQFSDMTGTFLFERNIKELADKLSVLVETVSLPYEEESNNTALTFAKANFPITSNTIPDNAGELLKDGSLQFICPFISREEELRYVVKSISKRLKSAYRGAIRELVRMARNDVAIVLAIDKDNFEERISNLFREVGLFVFDEDKCNKSSFADVDTSTFEPVYFERQKFLDTDVKYNSGESLDYQNKHIMFERLFSRIDINRSSRPIASYPIGQFVLELYRIIGEGLSIEGFKSILYSNWRYNVDKIQLKWSDFISDFKYIEMYFEDKRSLQEWTDTALQLSSFKSEIDGNALYLYHPLKQIKADSLAFFCTLLCELQELTDKINRVVGSIDSHLNTLKFVVMKADAILNTEDEGLEFEQVILKKLALAINDIGTSSFMNNLDAKYFAQNVRAMLTDWESQNKTESENTIRLNVVNLENMKKYKYSYFIMCEADKYPRRYSDRFPFTADILEILKNPEYGIGVTPYEVKGLNYHLELERYLFKNVLDFTTEQVTITHCEKDNGSYNKPSIFALDVATAFGVDIPYTEYELFDSASKPRFTETLPTISIDKKAEYTLTELAIFKLCPKLYYHRQTDDSAGVYLSRLQLKFYMEAIFYCDVFKRFMDYNLSNKKVYGKSSDEHRGVINRLLQETNDANSKYFSFFTKYEIEDTVRNVSGKVQGFIENAMKNIKGNTYTVISYENKRYQGNGYELVIEHDNRVVDYDLKKWRMSQNSSYLEFLVLKTTDNKSELTHYADMITALDNNKADEDRVNLISRIIAKINIQFDSKRFAKDGIARTDELVGQVTDYDFSTTMAMPSGYCNYCRLNDVCMEI